ncbi:MAG: DUF4350 domain-containing protein [Polyangiales bacterium]
MKSLHAPLFARWTALVFGVLLALAVPRPASAQTDYDPRSMEWNGTSELLRIATEADIDVRPVRTLDWEALRPGEAVLVLYPRHPLGVVDLSAFLDDGGRVAWFDDFGASEQFFDWFQFHRETRVRGTPRTPELPELLLARPRSAHMLTDGVDVLVTNIPVALTHPRLSPVFDFPPDGQGFVLVGQIGRGKLVVGGDPSLMLNTMMRFAGNRAFAKNLLTFLDGGNRGPVYLVWGDAQPRGTYRGRNRPRTPIRGAVNTLNDSLTALSQALSAPLVLRPFAMLLCLGAACVMAALTWGRKPSERYGPRGPVGTAAGIAERVSLYTAERVNLLIPALRARRYFEQSLLRSLGARASTDVRAAVDRASDRLDATRKAEVRAVLSELDAIASAAEDAAPPRVTPARFLSLWRRIDAILRAVSS